MLNVRSHTAFGILRHLHVVAHKIKTHLPFTSPGRLFDKPYALATGFLLKRRSAFKISTDLAGLLFSVTEPSPPFQISEEFLVSNLLTV